MTLARRQIESGGPYRASPESLELRCRPGLTSARDALVVLAGLATLLLLRHWPGTIEFIATQVLGFPSLRL